MDRLSRAHKRMLLLLPLTIPLTGALNLLVDESRNAIMPDDGKVVPGTIVTAKKGEIFFRQPLGRTYAAALEADVSFTFLGKSVTIAKSEQLIRAHASGTASNLVGSKDSLYCTAAKLTGKKRVVGMSELAEIGMDLDAIAKLRHVRTQSCLIDVGRDGTADKAFVADTSNRDEFAAVAITSTSISKLGLARMPGESEARVMFDGMVGIIGNMSTSVQIVEEGIPLAFGNSQTMFKGSGLPHTVSAFGGVFTILSYDKKNKSAQIRIDRAFATGEYDVKTTIRYR
jgi:hypothetical protein